MIEMTLEEATIESLADAAVIMAVGIGDRHMSNVLLGRKEFARVAGNPALVAETKILRVKVEGEEQLDVLKARVKEAKGELDPDVKEPSVKEPSVKEPSVKEPNVKEPSVKEPSVKEPSVKEAQDEPEPVVKEPKARKSSSRKAKAEGDE